MQKKYRFCNFWRRKKECHDASKNCVNSNILKIMILQVGLHENIMNRFISFWISENRKKCHCVFYVEARIHNFYVAIAKKPQHVQKTVWKSTAQIILQQQQYQRLRTVIQIGVMHFECSKMNPLEDIWWHPEKSNLKKLFW